MQDLHVYVSQRMDRSVVLEWDSFKPNDERRLLGYVIYYKETLYENVTMYDNRDACGGDKYV